MLSVAWHAQTTFSWCGPASTTIALSSRMPNPPSQPTLAAFMGTTVDGTDNVGLVAGALNHFLGTKAYHPTDIASTPTPAETAQLKADVVKTIGAGYPMVMNIVSGWRPPFYPQGETIYHYVALVGYDLHGDKVLLADPAAGGGGAWAGVPQEYWLATTDTAVWIGSRGYASF